MPLVPALAAALVLAAPPAPAPVAAAADLAWLAGCWQAVDAEPGSGELWSAPAGGTLLGVARTVRDGRTVAHEFLQIRETGDGGLVYVALPSLQREASFPLLRLAPHEAVFANPEHDFPQRISYRLEADGTLRARIEGDAGRRRDRRRLPDAARAMRRGRAARRPQSRRVAYSCPHGAGGGATARLRSNSTRKSRPGRESS
ncbi:MAG: DUF6265 family protein [Thermoanaerobaculia bacterium]|nr:DUF6265 family protein [Thermoanaerobaculia bacterium]